MQVDISKLRTIKNYAADNSVTPSYIYKLVKEKKIKIVMVDGVQFIDATAFPSIQKR